MMFYSGLVSISFRSLAVEAVVELCAKAGLACIEWGGDVHVPAGEIETAERVGKLTRDAGMRVSSYGSYYRVGDNPDYDFAAVLDSAQALGAKMIRVWAGRQGSEEANADYRGKVIDDARAIGDAAAKRDMMVCFEYHGNTLTDTTSSAIRLLRDEVAHDCVKTFWQPPWQRPFTYRLEGLEQVARWVTNVHCFAWDMEHQRFALSSQHTEWGQYLGVLKKQPSDHDVLLEFVKDDSPEQLLEDAKTLNDFLACL